MVRALAAVATGLLLFGGLCWALTAWANRVIDRFAGRDPYDIADD